MSTIVASSFIPAYQRSVEEFEAECREIGLTGTEEIKRVDPERYEMERLALDRKAASIYDIDTLYSKVLGLKNLVTKEGTSPELKDLIARLERIESHIQPAQRFLIYLDFDCRAAREILRVRDGLNALAKSIEDIRQNCLSRRSVDPVELISIQIRVNSFSGLLDFSQTLPKRIKKPTMQYAPGAVRLMAENQAQYSRIKEFLNEVSRLN